MNENIKVHTSNLFEHIMDSLSVGRGQEMAALKIPFNTFIKLINEVAEVASEINNPELNCLMMKLSLYSVSDPDSKEYNAEFVSNYIETYGGKSKQNNGWISVDERLPEERQTVLIAIKNGRDYAISMATYQKHYEKMKWIEPNYDYYGIEEVTLDFNQVEYWQPLPQPPKDVKNE